MKQSSRQPNYVRSMRLTALLLGGFLGGGSCNATANLKWMVLWRRVDGSINSTFSARLQCQSTEHTSSDIGMWKSQKVESAILSLLFYIYNKRSRGKSTEKKLFNYFMRRAARPTLSLISPISSTTPPGSVCNCQLVGTVSPNVEINLFQLKLNFCGVITLQTFSEQRIINECGSGQGDGGCHQSHQEGDRQIDWLQVLPGWPLRPPPAPLAYIFI